MKYFQFMDLRACFQICNGHLLFFSNASERCLFKQPPKNGTLLPVVQTQENENKKEGNRFGAKREVVCCLSEKTMEFAQKTRSDKSPNICQLATFYKSCMHLVHKNISIGLFDNGKRYNGNWFYPLWKLIGFTIGCSIKFAIITNECCFNTVEKKNHLQIAIENISYRQLTTFSID